MSTRLAAALATLATVTAAALLMAGPAAAVLSGDGSGGVAPLAPTDAEALATDPDAETGGMTATTVVDGSVVLAAASLPGANTFVDPDLSPEEAVGIAPTSDGDLSPDKLRGCWANAVWHRWGTWPYQQKIIDTTYWCAVYGGHITYQTSTTTTSGTLCSPSLPANQLIAGGVGKFFTYFTVRASSVFSCATVIPWVTIHETHHEDVRRDDRGKTSVVRTG